jgi:hypothetical protein
LSADANKNSPASLKTAWTGNGVPGLDVWGSQLGSIRLDASFTTSRRLSTPVWNLIANNSVDTWWSVLVFPTIQRDNSGGFYLYANSSTPAFIGVSLSNGTWRLSAAGVTSMPLNPSQQFKPGEPCLIVGRCRFSLFSMDVCHAALFNQSATRTEAAVLAGRSVMFGADELSVTRLSVSVMNWQLSEIRMGNTFRDVAFDQSAPVPPTTVTPRPTTTTTTPTTTTTTTTTTRATTRTPVVSPTGTPTTTRVGSGTTSSQASVANQTLTSRPSVAQSGLTLPPVNPPITSGANTSTSSAVTANNLSDTLAVDDMSSNALGIGVGVGVAAIVLAGAIFIWIYVSRRRQKGGNGNVQEQDHSNDERYSAPLPETATFSGTVPRGEYGPVTVLRSANDNADYELSAINEFVPAPSEEIIYQGAPPRESSIYDRPASRQ